MLTVAKITQNAAGGYAEYLEGRTQASELGDYYLKDGERVEAPGRWVTGANLVGADADAVVTGEQLRALLDVRRPDTGRPLRAVGAGGTAVAALDATFSAPKSVSAVWALADRELRAQIEAAHERAISRALEHSVGHVAMIRERVERDTVMHRRPAGLIATSWRHTTARAVGGRAPDPQLHSHVLLHAAARTDGQLMAIDSRAWLVHRRELGAAYRTELAHGLAELGFSILARTGRGGRYFEIDGVPAALLDRWSSRDREIRAAISARVDRQRNRLLARMREPGPDAKEAADQLATLERTHQLSPKENRAITAMSRGSKSADLTTADLDAVWGRAGGEHQFGREQLGALRSAQPTLRPDADAVLAALTEHDATFTARTARATALEVGVGAPIPHALDQVEQLRQSGQIIGLADGTLSTDAHRARETVTVETVRAVARNRPCALPAQTVEQEIVRLDDSLRRAGGALSSEQREAIALACGDRQIVVIEGQAGTGKSTVLTAVGQAHQAHGQTLIVTSTAALTAERLSRDLAGADVRTRAYSTAALQGALRSGALTLGPDTTIIHDEAALAGTREQHALLTAVHTSGARLIAVGDPGQNQPVTAAGLWPRLELAARHHHAHAQLTVNVRALDPADDTDQRRFRDGNVREALSSFERRGRLTITPTHADAEDRALDAAQHDRDCHQRTLVIAQTSNEHLDELNARAQAIRIERGELAGAGTAVPGRPYRLHAGDEIQIRRTHRTNQDVLLRNGTAGHVACIDPDAHTASLALDNGQTVTLDARDLRGADVRLAYVQHPFPAQGQTVDATHLIVGTGVTQHGSYVGLTRARQRTDIYASTEQLAPDPDTNRVSRLADQMSQAEPDLPSIDSPLAHERGVERSELTALPSPTGSAERQGTQTTDRDRLVNDIGYEP